MSSIKVNINFEVELHNVDHTEQELENYLRFEFKDNGKLSKDNPFNKSNQNCEPIFGTFEWDYS